MANNEMSLDEFLAETEKGQLFTVDFFKRGTTIKRTMNCRRGVRKGVKGTGRTYDPTKYQLLTVYDMQALDAKAAHNQGKDPEDIKRGAFRNIALENLVGLRMAGKQYAWDQGSSKFLEIA